MMSRIVIDPMVRHGKPVIKGTRVPIDVILGSLASGMSSDEVAREYGITKKDVLATIEYAAKLVSKEEIEEYA
jgi:uncharacterized protein (DUF433 family)